MQTAAICSRARNRIAKTLGLKIPHVHPEKLTSTVWTNQLAGFYLWQKAGSEPCRKKHKDQEEEWKTTTHKNLKAFLKRQLFWEKLCFHFILASFGKSLEEHSTRTPYLV